MKNNTVIQ